MGVLGTCTARALKGNPMRTAVTVVGIILSTALILAVATSALSLYRYIVDMERELSGAYNAMVLGASPDEVAAVEGAAGVTAAAAVERQGWAIVNEASESTPYLNVEAVAGGEEGARAFADLVSLRLTEGRMPEGPDEILLPESVVASGLVDVAVGERLTLELGRRVDDETGMYLDDRDYVVSDRDGYPIEHLEGTWERTFVVCGFYADNRALFKLDGGNGGDVAGLPALTAAAAAEGASQVAGNDAPREPDAPVGTGVCQVWLAVADPAFAGEIAAELFPGASVFLNEHINRLTSFVPDVGFYRTLVALTVLILAVVIGASTMLIRNSFAISVSERTRQFGLLASVGATRRQLRGMVLREALALGCIAAPIGIALGYGGCALVFGLCQGLVGSWTEVLIGIQDSQSVLEPVFSWPVVVLAVALALATALLSARGPARRAGRMPAVDAIRSSADVKVPSGVRRSGRVCGALFGVEGAIAARSFRRAAKPRRATVASLVTGTVLVVTAVLLGAYVNAFFAVAAPEARLSYDISYWFDDSRISGTAGGKATVGEAVDTLLGAEGVTQGVGVLETVTNSWFGEDGMGREVLTGEFAASAPASFNVTVQFVPDDEYRAWLEDEGLDADILMDPENPCGVAVNRLNGSVDGRYAELPVFIEEPFTYIGVQEVRSGSELDDTLVFEAADTAADGEAAPSFGHHRIEVKVAAFAEEGPWWLGTPSLPVILLPLSAVSAVDPSLSADPDGLYANRSWKVLVRTDDPNVTEADLRARLHALGLSDSRLYNMTASTAGMVSLFSTVKMFIWAFAVIVTLIAVTGAFNTMHTGVGLRRREFAVLRSVGMTRRGLARMLLCECLVYGAHVLAWSAPLCCGVSLLLQTAMGPSVAGMAYIVPWAVVPTVAGAFLVVVAACAYAVRRVDVGASPLDALRAEGA